MLTLICQYLKNWFNRKPDGSDCPKYYGTFTITDGQLTLDKLTDGQYFRIMGSLLNDGVHCTTDVLRDETFTGAVWSLMIPPSVIQLATEIEAWQAKYGGIENMSPYQSESFGGYSYSKGGGGESGDTSKWQNQFAEQLSPWRKI